MIGFANQAIESLSENHWIRGYCAMSMGIGFWGNGNPLAAKNAFSEAASVGKISGNKRVAVTSAGYLGHTLELEGRLQQAVGHLKESLQLTQQDGAELPVAAYCQERDKKGSFGILMMSFQHASYRVDKLCTATYPEETHAVMLTTGSKHRRL